MSFWKNLFTSKSSENALGLFQFENLRSQRVPFKLIALLNEAEATTKLKELNPMYAPKSLTDFEAFVKDNHIQSVEPLVLICKNGKLSRKISSRLVEKGFQNTYYLEQGQKALEV